LVLNQFFKSFISIENIISKLVAPKLHLKNSYYDFSCIMIINNSQIIGDGLLMNDVSRFPIIIAGNLPYRLIFLENDSWKASLEEINHLKYDYVKLHRITDFLDIGYEDFYLIIGFDGSLILPFLGKFANKITYQKLLNTFLGKLLFGGIFCEALTPEDISLGELTKEGYYRYISSPKGSGARIHHLLQELEATPYEAIKLYNPQIIQFEEMKEAYKKGDEFFSDFPNISIDLLLRGISFLIKWEWSEAIIFIWTSIEQVIDKIWKKEFVQKSNIRGVIKKRKKFLEDTRTWTASARIEMFYQKELIDTNTYQLINNIRKARNDFIHGGVMPSEHDALDGLKALLYALSLSSTEYLIDDKLDYVYDLISERVQRGLVPERIEISDDQIDAWKEILPIPGYESWGEKNFEKVKNFGFKKVTEDNLKNINEKFS
jgi:hypothetical protein